MAGNLERALAVLELLAKNGGRMPLAAIADTLNIPRSGTHRLLSMLIDEGFVRQDEGAPMHGRQPLGAQVPDGLNGLVGVHVDVPHEPPRQVRPDPN